MINCMLIDDDPAVIFYMKGFIEKTPFLKLISAHTSPNDAVAVLQANDIQLIFLDIDLPGITGIEFSRILSANTGQKVPRVIFISSTEVYALESYRVNALNYLLKPILYEDFFNAAYKALSIIEAQKTDYSDTDHLFLRVEYELVKVYLKDILYFEAFQNYVKVYTKNSSSFIKALTTIKSIEEKLPPNSFIRVHRSFIISVDKIESITKNTVKIGKTLIPVSEQYKNVFKTFLDKWF